MGKRKLGKFLAGVGLGVGLGMLFAPKSGSETRKELKEKIDELLRKAKEIDVEDLKDDIQEKINELKLEIADLDKEKVLRIAQEKGKELLKKADELVKIAVEKGTPVVEKAAHDVKNKTAEVLKEVVKKLETDSQKKTK